MAKKIVTKKVVDQLPIVVDKCPLCEQVRPLNIKWRGGCYCYVCGMDPNLRHNVERVLGLKSPGSTFKYKSR